MVCHDCPSSASCSPTLTITSARLPTSNNAPYSTPGCPPPGFVPASQYQPPELRTPSWQVVHYCGWKDCCQTIHLDQVPEVDDFQHLPCCHEPCFMMRLYELREWVRLYFTMSSISADFSARNGTEDIPTLSARYGLRLCHRICYNQDIWDRQRRLGNERGKAPQPGGRKRECLRTASTAASRLRAKPIKGVVPLNRSMWEWLGAYKLEHWLLRW